MINNFEETKKLMKFEPGTYYKFMALIRAKDKSGVLNTNERGEIFVRQWFVDSEEAYLKYREDMINLCNACGARLYVTTDRKSVKKTVFKMQEQLNDIIKQYAFGSNNNVSIRKLSKFSSSASSLAECSDGPKYWLVDIDNNDGEADVEQILKDFKLVFDNKEMLEFKTLNGYHLLFKRTFGFRDEFAKLWKKSKDKKDALTETSYKVYEKVEQAFERLWKTRDNWAEKENALTLVYFNKEN